MNISPNELQAASTVAEGLIRRGIPRDEVCRAIARVMTRHTAIGLGQPELLRAAAEARPIKIIRETISPWMWVFSVIGFGLALINTRRIAKIFKRFFGDH